MTFMLKYLTLQYYLTIIPTKRYKFNYCFSHVMFLGSDWYKCDFKFCVNKYLQKYLSIFKQFNC